MLLSFVVPEIILGVVAAPSCSRTCSRTHPPGHARAAPGADHVPDRYPVIIVRARLLSIGKEYEEAAMDLGATPNQSIRRVLLPLLYPAIFASFALVFADTVDDFVTVHALSGPANSQPLSIKIYSTARASPTPAVNAAATMMLVTTLLVIAGGYLRLQALHAGPGARRRDGLRAAVADRRPLRGQALRRRRRRARRSRGRRCRLRAAPAGRRAGTARRPRRPERTARPSPSFGTQAWIVCAAREVHDHLQRSSRRRPSRSTIAGHPVLAGRAAAARCTTRSGRIVTFTSPTVSASPLPATSVEVAELTLQPPSVAPAACGVHQVRHAEEVGDVGGRRLLVDLLGRARPARRGPATSPRCGRTS